MIPYKKKTSDTIRRIANGYFLFLNKLYQTVRIISITLLVVITAIVAYIVVLRYVFGTVPEWGREIARFLAIWMAFLYAAALIWKDDHLQVEVVFQKLSLKNRSRLRIVQLIFIIILSIILIEFGTIYALDGMDRISLAAGIPMGYALAIIPVTGFLFLLFSTGKLLQTILSPEILDVDYMRKYDSDASEELLDD